MKYSLFLGCTIPARSRNYEMSTRNVGAALGVEFAEIPGQSCCGFPIKSVHHMSFFLMAARNLVLAEKQNLPIATMCSACTSILTEVNKELKEHGKVRKEVNTELAKLNPQFKFEGSVTVKHVARILYEDVGIEAIRAKIAKPLTALKIAVHYGCHYLKPSDIYEGFDDSESPSSLDELVRVTGAATIPYDEKRICCGGGILAIDQNIAFGLAGTKLARIAEAGADAICLVCPFCSVMYDANQKGIEAAVGKSFGLPVLYLPQLLGLAMGFADKDLGLNMNTVKTKDLLAKVA